MPAPTRTIIEPFWRRLQQQRTAQNGRLSDWWSRCVGNDITIGTIQHKRLVQVRGDKLVEVRNPFSRPLKREHERVVAWHWCGWLVVSKHAPKWVRNWAKRETFGGRRVEVWAPLTLAVVQECVRFERDCQRVRRVHDALKEPPSDDLPF